MKKMKLFRIVGLLLAFSMLLVACGSKGGSSSAQNDEGFKKPDGTLVKNEWVKVDDKYYFYDENGKLVKDAYVEDTYYVDENGVMVRNTWHKDKNNGKYYYFCDDGKYEMDNWVNHNGDWFYLDNTGAMVTNAWVEDLYYVDSEGKMLKNTITPDGYYVDENGRYRSQQELNQIAASIAAQQAKQKQSAIKAATQRMTNSPFSGRPYVGQRVAFGKYQGEPISWNVIDVVPGRALLLSTNIIDYRPMSGSSGDTVWGSSYLRAWLNNDFYNAAFANVNKDLIAATSVANTMNPKTTTKAGNDTWDKVFLLSIAEVERYRQVLSAGDMFRPTYSGFSNNTRPASHKGEWWLRTPGSTRKETSFVEPTGTINYNGAACDLLAPGVRPAIWVKY